MAVVWRAVGIILLLGLVGGLVSARLAQSARDSALETQVQSEAAQIASELDLQVQSAISSVLSLGETMSDGWKTTEDFDFLWRSVRTALPGDTDALILVSVPPEDLDAFVDAQTQLDPSFEVALLTEAPPEPGHLFITSSSDASQRIGADLSSIPGIAAAFARLEPATVRINGADLRSPISPPPGQAQIVYRTSVERPDGGTGSLWTIAQIDSAFLLEQALDERSAAFGAALQLNVNEKPVLRGVPERTSEATTSFAVGDDGLELMVDLWTDGSDVETATGQDMLIAALIATLGAATMVGLCGTVIVYARRADRGERDARHDELTGLPNRRWLVERLDQADGGIALLFCDLDRFKIVNDSVGHAAGDELLVRVSERTLDVVGDRAAVARFGGDEFIVLVSSSEPMRVAQELAGELIDAMHEPFSIEGGTFRTSMSIGISGGDAPAVDAEELIRSADVALGHAKSNGRDTWVVYDTELRKAEQGRLELESELQTALDDSAFTMHFQPIVDEDLRLSSYEALVRWERDGQLVSPGVFLPLVQEVGRMGDLGRIVLRRALQDFVDIAGDGDTTLHVNVDASQLLDPTFPDEVLRVLDNVGLDPARLTLELTEGEWLDSDIDLNATFGPLSAAGIGIAIDDFGSGYSSLARILAVPGLTEIKIDRSMVVSAVDPRTGAIVAGLVEIARRLDVKLVAEGVEQMEEFSTLQRAGIPLYQGYLFGRPGELTEEAHASWLTGDGSAPALAKAA